MAVGQAVLRAGWDVPAVLALEERLEQSVNAAGRAHAAVLRDVLDLHAQHLRAGMPLSTVPQVALLLRCSEWRAGRMLDDALGLAELPEGLASLETGLLTVEQSSVVVAQLAPLTPPLRLQVWRRLQVRLVADLEQGVVRPPARLTELLKRWVLEADAEAAALRRQRAEDDRRVEYRRRDDGLVDLLLLGLRAPDAQVVLQRIRSRSAKVGVHDERTADQRRLDAACDLLLGRAGTDGDCCPPGSSAPCGADVQVLVPLGAALGTTDETAELVGHGPVERDLLEGLLARGPRLTPVWVDGAGVPVAVGRSGPRLDADDARGVRDALLALAETPPPQRPPPHDHPPDEPGPYEVRGLDRRYLFARSPRCEFPICGVPAVRCDVEHDVPWPLGPSCPCNCGPCCRRHHRMKQEGWTKTRAQDSSVAWTSPSGLQRTSGVQHAAPAAAVRPVPPLAVGADPWDDLSPLAREEELWWLDGCPADPASLELRQPDAEVPDEDDLSRRLEEKATGWSVDLDDPYAWLDETSLAVLPA